MYIVPGQELTTPWGRNFDVNRNIMSLRSFVASFKQISLKSDFIQFFHDFILVCSSGVGVDSSHGTKFCCQQKGLITLPICCKFQRNLVEVWFSTFFFHDLIHVYSSGAGGIQPQGTKFWCQKKLLVPSVICCWFQIIDYNSFWKNLLFYLFHIQKKNRKWDPLRAVKHS